MYVAVKGGETAILNSYKLLAEQRRGDTEQPELSVEQIRQQLKLSVDRVMTEGSVFDPELAALAIKQASGDLVEAIFLLRAYRATLPRLGNTCALDTSCMQLDRRISATFKDLPGGQVLGPTYDYTQRLLDFTLLANAQGAGTDDGPQAPSHATPPPSVPRVVELLNQEGLIETFPALRMTPTQWISHVSRCVFLRTVPRACKTSHAVTKAFCWLWPIPPNAAIHTHIRLWARCAWVKSQSR